jgi:hypothetical protein
MKEYFNEVLNFNVRVQSIKKCQIITDLAKTVNFAKYYFNKLHAINNKNFFDFFWKTLKIIEKGQRLNGGPYQRRHDHVE